MKLQSSDVLLLSAGTQNYQSPEPDKLVETLSLSSLLIVLRYSTVVVLVVEVVVVVVLEVVSASSQQRPVSQSVQLWLFNISRLNDLTVAALQFRSEPLRFDLFLNMRLRNIYIYIF